MTRMRGMNTDKIVTGQPVKPAKVERARRLRRRMTEAEKILWQHLRGNRLRGFHFRRQQLLDGFIVDFYCHAAGLVVEVDGGVHRQQAEYDAERDRVLMARGLRVVRFENEEVRQEVARVLARIEGELPNPPAPFPEGKGEKAAMDTEFPLSAPERGSGGEVAALCPGSAWGQGLQLVGRVAFKFVTPSWFFGYLFVLNRDSSFARRDGSHDHA